MTPVPPVTDEEALLAAIAAAPLDDAPRLVYADWLQERGADEEAEYVRAVVALSHPPEDPALVERCFALAEDLDADWRQAVGGRFEVILEGSPALNWLAHMFQSVMNFAVREPIRLWVKGEPIRLQASLTREDAEAYVRAFPNLAGSVEDDPAPARLYVRPTTDDGPTLFAPSTDG